jgi:hypothetical protein
MDQSALLLREVLQCACQRTDCVLRENFRTVQHQHRLKSWGTDRAVRLAKVQIATVMQIEKVFCGENLSFCGAAIAPQPNIPRLAARRHHLRTNS